MSYFEISSLENENVNEVFKFAIGLCLKRFKV